MYLRFCKNFTLIGRLTKLANQHAASTCVSKLATSYLLLATPEFIQLAQH